MSDVHSISEARGSRVRLAAWLLAIALLAAMLINSYASASDARQMKPGPVFLGMCDASAAVALDEQHFLVANDEDSILRLYHRDRGDLPLQEFDLNTYLKPDGKEGKYQEVDIEGAMRVGQRIYWIASHGQNKNGKPRPSRHRFFATDIATKDGYFISGVGKPYERLLDDLAGDVRLKGYDLREAAKKAPKSQGGLNIEGLGAAPDGKLLIGFRNPIPGGKALVVTLENPDDVLFKNERPKLGEPAMLDLGGRGVRSLDYQTGPKAFLLVAGAYDTSKSFALYLWSGKPGDEPKPLEAHDFGGLSPEAFVVYPGEKRIQILGDDGTKNVDGQECKEVDNPAKRSFRSGWVALDL
jgi:hypothetical protein